MCAGRLVTLRVFCGWVAGNDAVGSAKFESFVLRGYAVLSVTLLISD